MIKFRVWDKTRNEYLSKEFVETFEFRLFNSNFYIFEQFTGQKDKHGKDIYVGDIVYYGRDEENFVIGYDKTISSISICNGDVCYTFDNLYGKDLEIIGNINENKELENEK